PEGYPRRCLSIGRAAHAGHRQRHNSGRSALSSRKQARNAEGRPRRPAFDTHQRSMAYMLSMDGSRRRGRRDHRLPLERSVMNIRVAYPIHPGEFLREEYLVPLGISAGALAKALHLPRTRIERIVKEEVGVTPDTALRLARYFKTTPEFWM